MLCSLLCRQGQVQNREYWAHCIEEWVPCSQENLGTSKSALRCFPKRTWTENILTYKAVGEPLCWKQVHGAMYDLISCACDCVCIMCSMDMCILQDVQNGYPRAYKEKRACNCYLSNSNWAGGMCLKIDKKLIIACALTRSHGCHIT